MASPSIGGGIGDRDPEHSIVETLGAAAAHNVARRGCCHLDVPPGLLLTMDLYSPYCYEALISVGAAEHYLNTNNNIKRF